MKLDRFFISLALGVFSISAQAQECRLRIGVGPILKGDVTDDAIARQFEAKMRNALTGQDIVVGGSDSQFFITGRFDHSYSQETAGPGGKVMVKTNLQLAIADNLSNQIYASATIPLTGVGSTDIQAMNRALGSLKPANPELTKFAATGRNKIINYFDNNYSHYISKAQSAMKARDYVQALYYLTMIPECCKGYNEAESMINAAYQDYIDYEGEQLLSHAEGAWAADPTDAGASKAYSFLSQIDPAAACYPRAKTLGKKMADVVKANWDFENKEKYKDEVALRRQSIEAARAIGVAWGENQPKKEYHVNYIWR